MSPSPTVLSADPRDPASPLAAYVTNGNSENITDMSLDVWTAMGLTHSWLHPHTARFTDTGTTPDSEWYPLDLTELPYVGDGMVGYFMLPYTVLLKPDAAWVEALSGTYVKALAPVAEIAYKPDAPTVDDDYDESWPTREQATSIVERLRVELAPLLSTLGGYFLVNYDTDHGGGLIHEVMVVAPTERVRVAFPDPRDWFRVLAAASTAADEEVQR